MLMNMMMMRRRRTTRRRGVANETREKIMV